MVYYNRVPGKKMLAKNVCFLDLKNSDTIIQVTSKQLSITFSLDGIHTAHVSH